MAKRPGGGSVSDGDVIGVRGAINHYGVVIAHERIWGNDESNHHTDEELACGTTFCWDIIHQEFENPRRPQPRNFTDDEYFKVIEYLESGGYKETE